jgi:3-deoxy-D-manno-octulosonate 8-phosphate phosphatase (KDO 8-P phosphatase)
MSFTDFQQIEQLFRGSFLMEPAMIYDKLAKVKAYVFDWDGVFNNGEKNENGSSPYNEVDSMGINMLRFNHFLRTGQNPVVAVVSGEKNTAAFTLAKREHFHAVYYKVIDKKQALAHLCSAHNIQPHEVAFFFDDVLDLSIAGVCGLRIMVGNDCNPMLQNLVKEKNFADYITQNGGGNNGLRESLELLMGLTGRYDETILQRVNFSDDYKLYLDVRNTFNTVHYTSIESNIIERSPL